MNHVMLISGSVQSLAAAWYLAEKIQTRPTLIFADTLVEHPDTYRLVVETAFLVTGRSSVTRARLVMQARQLSSLASEALPVSPAPRRRRLADLRTAVNLAVPEMAWLMDGRTPWEVVGDAYAGGQPACARILKEEVILSYLTAHYGERQVDVTLYVGLPWDERCRMDGPPDRPGLRQRWGALGWTVDAPLLWPPVETPQGLQDLIRGLGVAPHALDQAGLEHANCSGFCFSSGPRQYARFLSERPYDYAVAEAYSGAAPLVACEGGRLTLKEYRESAPGMGLSYPRERSHCLAW